MEDMRFLLFSFGFDREGAGKPLMPASPGKGFPSEWRAEEGQVAEMSCCCLHEEPEPRGAGGSLHRAPSEGLKPRPHQPSHAAWQSQCPAFSLVCTEAWHALTEALAAELCL